MHRAKSRPWLTKTTIFTAKLARRFDQSVRPVILDASGLAALSVAGFHINPTAGWTVVGIACFALQWRLRDGKSS